jgi:hypothetical protein
MPREEQTAVVDAECVVDMGAVVKSVLDASRKHGPIRHIRHKVIKTIAHSWILFSWKMLRLPLHTQHRICIVDALSSLQLSPTQRQFPLN